jgi:hypothetical protein
MSRKILRFAIYAVIAIGAYYAMRYYAVIRFGQHLRECSTPAELAVVGNNSASESARYAISTRVYGCVVEKQSFVERVFLKVPEAWLSPPPAQR